VRGWPEVGVPTAAEAAAEGCSSARRFRRGSGAMLQSRTMIRGEEAFGAVESNGGVEGGVRW
jgi:hypothetical protein